MNVLITGSSGFFGNIIVNICSKKFARLVLLSRFNSDYNCDLVERSPILNEKFNIVIHAAGKAHSVPKTEAEKKKFFDVNVTGTENLLKGLEQSGIPKYFVFISSVSVYGQEFGEAIDENHSLDAKDSYGMSKIQAERMIYEWCQRHNVICTILRLPLLVGEKALGNLGAMIEGIEKGYYFNIAGGKAKKSMVLAEDIANFIPKVAFIGGTYNLTDGYHPSFFELSSAIAKKNNKSVPLNMPLSVARILGFIGDFIGDKAPINSLKLKKMTSDLTFDDSKARAIGWQSRRILHWYNL